MIKTDSAKENYLLSIKMCVEENKIKYLSDFHRQFASSGNIIKPCGKNELDQVFIDIKFKTPDAVIWMYRWIHMFMLDGQVNKAKDPEIQWIVGTPVFVDLVYQILYKQHFQDTGSIRLDQIKATSN